MLESWFVDRRRVASILLTGYLLIFPEIPSWAQELTSETGSVLQQRIEAIEKLDGELAQVRAKLKALKKPADRRRLQARLQELESQQEKLIQELEQIVGPLPPAVRSEPPPASERQWKSHEQRHETTLESDVERRLPSQ